MTADDWKRRSVFKRVSNSIPLEVTPKTHFEVLSDFTNETLEGKLADKKFGRLLVATNFTESNSSGAEAMRLLHTTSNGLTKNDSVNN